MVISNDRFDRYKSREKYSWAYKVFKKYLEEINDFYWSFSPMLHKEVCLSENESDDIDSKDFFCVNSDDVRRIPKTLIEWRKSILSFDKWNRLNLLIAAISNLETYLSSVCRVAFESDPSLLITYLLGFQKKIDGVFYLKNGYFDNEEYKKIINNIEKSITMGDWNSRSSNFYKIFPTAPACIKNNIRKLENIRVMRNNAAHALGRDISSARQNRSLNTPEMDNLQEDDFKLCLKIIYDIATEIDKFLLDNFIGSYEIIYFYHNEYVKGNDIKEYNGDIMIGIKKQLTSMEDLSTWPKEYIKDLINYYHGVNSE